MSERAVAMTVTPYADCGEPIAPWPFAAQTFDAAGAIIVAWIDLAGSVRLSGWWR